MARGARGTRRDRCVRALFALAAATMAVARAAAAEEDSATERILASLDVRGELAAIVPVAREAIERRTAVPRADRHLLRAIVATGFDPETLERGVRDAFALRYHGEHAVAAATWLRLPEVRRLYAASQRPAHECNAGRQPVDTVRHRASARILAATHVAARAQHHARDVLVALLVEANRALPAWRRAPRSELVRLVAAQRATEARLAPAVACTYRGFGTAELVRAQAFLESEAGRWLHASVSAAVRDALADAARATAIQLVDGLDASSRVRLQVAQR